MTTTEQKSAIQTETPAEILAPTTDALSNVVEQVRNDARQGANQYLADTIVSEGGE